MKLTHNNVTAFVGTYTKNDSKGIYRIDFNTINGNIENINLAYKVENPTYLCADKEKHVLYSTCKIDNTSGVASFKYWREKNELYLINYNLPEIKQPCHINFNNNKQILLSSNYHENKMFIYNTLDGLILNYPIIDSHSANGSTQEKPHIHCSMFTHDDKYILSIDLGINKLMVSTLEDNKLSTNKSISYSFPAGTGPRHITYSKTKPFYYVISELTSEIFVFNYNSKANIPFKNIQIISSLEKNYKGNRSGAAIKIHKSNKFLYTSDRGNNSLNLFYIDHPTGKLTHISSFSCNGNSPRDFQFDPTGNFLLCANEASNNISIFSIDPLTGVLTFINSQNIPTPVCIEFI